MTRSQGYELIGIAWLFLAAYDKPADWGSLLYGLGAGIAFFRAVMAATHPRDQKERI